MLLLSLALASWADQCSVAVYDYADAMCYVEDANPDDAVCSEYREYYPSLTGVGDCHDQ